MVMVAIETKPPFPDRDKPESKSWNRKGAKVAKFFVFKREGLGFLSVLCLCPAFTSATGASAGYDFAVNIIFLPAGRLG
jgi:hypothetical protein